MPSPHQNGRERLLRADSLAASVRLATRSSGILGHGDHVLTTGDDSAFTGQDGPHLMTSGSDSMAETASTRLSELGRVFLRGTGIFQDESSEASEAMPLDRAITARIDEMASRQAETIHRTRSTDSRNSIRSSGSLNPGSVPSTHVVNASSPPMGTSGQSEDHVGRNRWERLHSALSNQMQDADPSTYQRISATEVEPLNRIGVAPESSDANAEEDNDDNDEEEDEDDDDEEIDDEEFDEDEDLDDCEFDDELDLDWPTGNAPFEAMSGTSQSAQPDSAALNRFLGLRNARRNFESRGDLEELANSRRIPSSALSTAHSRGHDSDAPSDPDDDVNVLSSNEDFESGLPTTVAVDESLEMHSRANSLGTIGPSIDEAKEDSGSANVNLQSRPQRQVASLGRSHNSASSGHVGSGSRLINLRSETREEKDHRSKAIRTNTVRPRAPWVTPTSYLQPGIVLDGLQTLSIGSNLKEANFRQLANNTTSGTRASELDSSRDNGLSEISVAPRFGLVPPESLPMMAERAPDHKANVKEEWQVKVTLHAVDLNKGSMEGFMEAVNVPHSAKSVVTHFTGEIIDFVHHTLWTEKWKSSRVIDLIYWHKLKPFEDMNEAQIRKGIRSRKWLSKLCKDWVLMRWKERDFLNIRAAESGLTIDGFYYVCLRRLDGMTEGLYFDPSSSPYQKLRLYPRYETKGYTSTSWEYR